MSDSAATVGNDGYESILPTSDTDPFWSNFLPVSPDDSHDYATNINQLVNTGYTPKFHIPYDKNNMDSYYNAMAQEAQWERDDLLRKESYKREDSSYSRLFEELKAQGVNPALLMGSAAPTTGTANSYTTSAGKTSNYNLSQKDLAKLMVSSNSNDAKMYAALVGGLALVLAALL